MQLTKHRPCREIIRHPSAPSAGWLGVGPLPPGSDGSPVEAPEGERAAGACAGAPLAALQAIPRHGHAGSVYSQVPAGRDPAWPAAAFMSAPSPRSHEGLLGGSHMPASHMTAVMLRTQPLLAACGSAPQGSARPEAASTPHSERGGKAKAALTFALAAAHRAVLETQRRHAYWLVHDGARASPDACARERNRP